MRISAAVLGSLLLLAGCGGEQYGDLKEELNALTKDLKGKVEPLPVVKPYEPVPYEVSDLPDPFGTAKFETVARGAGTGSSKLKPDESRPKERRLPWPFALDRLPQRTVLKKEILQERARRIGHGVA